MKMIGIKLADGSFYPLLEEGVPAKKTLDLTTARDNQTAIMVDLYRSETSSMEDAEYAATLQIDDLVAHPNGEPDISFTIALDENNKLFAEINDGESGAHNTVTVSLVERASPEHAEGDNPYGPAITSGAALAAGGLAAAAKQKTDDDALDFSDLDLPEELDLTKPASDPEANGSAAPAQDVFGGAGGAIPGESDMFAPSGISSSRTDGENNFDAGSFDSADDVHFEDIDLTAFDAAPDADHGPDESAAAEKAGNGLGDFSDRSADTIVPAGQPPSEDGAEDFHFTAVDLPSFEELASEKTADENAAFGAAEIPASEEPREDDTGDFSFDTADIPPFGDMTEEKTSDESDSADVSSADAGGDFHFDAADLPSFDDIPSAQNGAADDGSSPAGDPADFAFAEAPADTASGADPFSDDFFDGIDIPSSETDTATRNIDSLDDLQFGETDDINTEEGTTATKYRPEKTIRKKTKAPVLICLLCALICVIAAILILFVIPSKYNVLLSHAPHESGAVLPSREIAAPREAEVLPAKPDEIVVAPRAETVAPVRPAAASKSTGDVVYRIKWGDTLWDIADAYYKNPWRYPRIARYNNIKNPDYIISGTTIRIPAE